MKHVLRLFLPCILLLTGCGNVKPNAPTLCASATAALKVATIARNAGKLTPGQIVAIDAAVDAIWPAPPAEPICNALPLPPTLSDVESAAVAAAILKLNAGGK